MGVVYERYEEPRNLVKAEAVTRDIVSWSWQAFDEDAIGEDYDDDLELPWDEGEPLRPPALDGKAPRPAPPPAGYGLQQVMDEAETIIRDAQAEADRIVTEARHRAQVVADQGCEEALERARQEMAEREEPVLRLRRDDLARAAQALVAATQQLQEQQEQHKAALEDKVLDAAFQIAEKIVGLELQTRPELVVDAVRGALDRLAASDMTVRLHPEDVPLVQQALLDLQAARNVGDVISFEADNRIERGGCVVVGDNGTVDTQPSSKLAQMRHLADN